MALPVLASSSVESFVGSAYSVDTTSMTEGDTVVVAFVALDGSLEDSSPTLSCSDVTPTIISKWIFKVKSSLFVFGKSVDTTDLVDFDLGISGEYAAFVSVWSGVELLSGLSNFAAGGNFEDDFDTYSGDLSEEYDPFGDSIRIAFAGAVGDTSGPHGAQEVVDTILLSDDVFTSFSIIDSHTPEEFETSYAALDNYVILPGALSPWVTFSVMLHGNELHTDPGDPGDGGGRTPCPPLRHRQRDDIWETPRIRVGPNKSHPTSAGEMDRRGHVNTYDGPGPCFGSVSCA
jgi:hypothetical protein